MADVPLMTVRFAKLSLLVVVGRETVCVRPADVLPVKFVSPL